MAFPFLAALAVLGVGALVLVTKKSSAAAPAGGVAMTSPEGPVWEILTSGIPVFTGPGAFTQSQLTASRLSMIGVGSYIVAGLRRMDAPPATATTTANAGIFTGLFKVTALRSTPLGPIYDAQYVRKYPQPTGATDPFPGGPEPAAFQLFPIAGPQVRDLTAPM